MTDSLVTYDEHENVACFETVYPPTEKNVDQIQIADTPRDPSGEIEKRSYIILEEMKSPDKQESEMKSANKQNYLASQTRYLLFEKALKSLQPRNKSQKMIALCGIAGIGKTTMMEQLKKTVEDSKMFDWVVKMVLGQIDDMFALQRVIAEAVGLDLFETNINERASRLRKTFESMSQRGEKKVLVIMDDIRTTIDLKVVGLTSPLPNGFKLMFTSRRQEICTQMGVKDDLIFKVDKLNEEEARALLFEIEVYFYLGDDPEFHKIVVDVVKECEGLPIALNIIANELRDQRMNYGSGWRERMEAILYDLRQYSGRYADPVLKLLARSYDKIKIEKDVDIQAIFFLSSLYPKDFNIPIEELTMYGWGLKLFTNVRTLVEARRKTKDCVHNLIRVNLLMESKSKGCVIMPGHVHSFVLSELSEDEASIVMFDRLLLRCEGKSKFPLDFKNRDNASLLLLMGENMPHKFPEDLYKRMERLEVVSYQNMHIPLLPVRSEHSTKLRTLYLRSCTLIDDDICSLGSLSNLEILSIVDCELKRLPSSIGKLKKLKSLDLTGCADLRIHDGAFRNMRSLEELYMRGSNKSPLRLTNTNFKELEILSRRLLVLEFEFFEKMTQLRNMSFKQLTSFQISIGCRLERFERYSFRNRLDLVADHRELFKCQIIELFERTEELKFQVNGMDHLYDVAMHRNSFSNLRVLHVSRCADLTYLFPFIVAEGLYRLEQLTISECPMLRTVVGKNNEVGEIRLEMLNSLTLESLPNMVSFSDNLLVFPEMVELRLDGLPNFISFSLDNDNNESEIQSLLNKRVGIPKLKKLDISRMENLKQIWSRGILTIPMLKIIEVRCCDGLTNLFRDGPLLYMDKLEVIKIEKCGSMEVLFNMDVEAVSHNTRRYNKLRSIEVSDLDELKELWRMKGIQKDGIPINDFDGVKLIKIRNCKRFTNLFTPTTTNFDLALLTTYTTINIGGDLDGSDTQNKEIKIQQEINYGYPSYPLCTFPYLQHLELHGDERVKEVVFDMDSETRLLHPYLEVLKLFDLNEMSHVWKCRWNKYLIPPNQPLQFPFQNLTHIYLHYCHKITYLFSPLMAKYLSNLECVDIYICHGIEQVVSSRDDEREENTAIVSTSSDIIPTLFPHLDTFKVYYLDSLKQIDNGDTRNRSGITSSNIITQGAQVMGWSFCQYAKHISIEKCDSLGSLIPWYAASQMQWLEELIINDCGTMIEVFESRSSNNSSNVDDRTAHGITSTSTSPTLNTTTLVPHLANLKSVSISNCDLLPYLFTFSTLESLKQLEVLRIKRCKTIQVIVKNEYLGTSSEVAFPSLHTLELDHLPNLEAFFLGKNVFHWPLLDDVTVINCPRLMMFTDGHSRTPKLENIRTNLGIRSLERGLNLKTTYPTSDSIVSEGMPRSSELKAITVPSSVDPVVSEWLYWSSINLKEINIEHADDEIVIPFNELRHLEKLENIRLTNSYSVIEVFGVALKEKNDGSSNESQIVLEIPDLRQVYLCSLRGLKYLYQANQSLVLEFPNLTTVSIHDCARLEHVFTSSMVGSLVNLEDLQISECDNLEVIVKEDEERDAKGNQIMLPFLKSLKLHDLSILKGFCLEEKAFSLPLLDTLQIKGCPTIMNFTKGNLFTPELKVIDTSFGRFYVTKDINSFITTKREEDKKPNTMNIICGFLRSFIRSIYQLPVTALCYIRDWSRKSIGDFGGVFGGFEARIMPQVEYTPGVITGQEYERLTRIIHERSFKPSGTRFRSRAISGIIPSLKSRRAADLKGKAKT